MTIKKLNIKNDSDKQFIRDYWTKINKGEKVDGRTLVKFSYFHYEKILIIYNNKKINILNNL